MFPPRGTEGEINQLSIVSSSEGGTFTQSEYYNYLAGPVVVTGGLLVSTSGCTLYNMEINVTVSTVPTNAGELFETRMAVHIELNVTVLTPR